MSLAVPGRRDFLAATGALLAGAALPERLLADPYAPLAVRRAPGAPVRVTGHVTVGGRPAAGVRVSDGRTVTRTAADGRYALRSDRGRPWVSVVLPRGARFPRLASGPAALHQPLRPDARGEATAHFALERAEGDDARHAFVVLADTQTQNAFEMGRLHAETVPAVRAALADARSGQRFGIACGDIMYDDLALLPEYERAVRAMDIPFLQVVGNHDLDFAARTTEQSTATFERHFGPPWYSFDVGEVHYIVLDDVLWYGDGYLGYLDADQLDWVAADLHHVEPGRTVVVALHIPLGSTRWIRTNNRDEKRGETVNNREALLRLLEPYAAHVVSGHTHEHEHVDHGRAVEHVLGTACGAWWSGDICWDGTPNGFALVDVNGSELRWDYRATGLPATHQLRVYGVGADPAAPEEAVANVWNWDARWEVTWYADGDRRGRMARRTGLDPRAVAEQAGRDRPARRSWVEPVPTAHLFYASVPAGTRELTVEARDPWGRVFTERLALGEGTRPG